MWVMVLEEKLIVYAGTLPDHEMPVAPCTESA